MKLGAAAKKRLARAAQSEEARQALREANAAVQRQRLGVTSLYQALQTRSYGECERRLLFDAHASGSASRR